MFKNYDHLKRYTHQASLTKEPWIFWLVKDEHEVLGDTWHVATQPLRFDLDSECYKEYRRSTDKISLNDEYVTRMLEPYYSSRKTESVNAETTSTTSSVDIRINSIQSVYNYISSATSSSTVYYVVRDMNPLQLTETLNQLKEPFKYRTIFNDDRLICVNQTLSRHEITVKMLNDVGTYVYTHTIKVVQESESSLKGLDVDAIVFDQIPLNALGTARYVQVSEVHFVNEFMIDQDVHGSFGLVRDSVTNYEFMKMLNDHQYKTKIINYFLKELLTK